MTAAGRKRWSDGALPLLSEEQAADVLGTAADLALVIEADGRIRSVLVDTDDRRLAPLADWTGQQVRDTLTPESVPKLEDALARLERDEGHRPAELNHRLRGGGELAMRYTFHALAGGDVMLVGRDLRAISELQRQLVEAQIALERDQEDRRALESRHRMLLAQTSDAFLLVDEGASRVIEANAAAAAFLGEPREALERAALGTVLAAPALSTLLDSAEGESVPGHLPGGRAVSVDLARFRAGGRRLLLLRLSGEDAAGGAPSRGGALARFWDAAPEGFVLADAQGTILSASDGLLALIDAASMAQVKGRSLATLLQRGSVDLRVLLENAARAGTLRAFATRLTGATGREVPVEISVTKLDDGAARFGLVIRDATHLDRGGPAVDEKAAASVSALVGNAPLREIVAETTDVVEKMCIETAVDLTSNNRVAAAEMLGLSRQSLYVKLRKYGLLNKDG